MEREKLGSRLGFILLSAGCAIGCGNVWKFPWMCGQYGGGGFVLLYFFCLVILGLPIMIMEFSVGRAAQASPIKMYQKLEKKGQKWHIHGYVSFFGSVALMAFYTVVTGWIVYYFVRFLTGNIQDLGFSSMITNPGVNVTYLAVTVVLAFGILCFGLQGGLERVTKYMMMLLLVLMLVLAVHSFTLSGAAEGLRFYLVPDRGHGCHGHFRQLHRKRALPDGGVGAHHRAGHLCGGGGGTDHVPGLLYLWGGGQCRPQPAV